MTALDEEQVDSPCVNLCKLDPERGTCLGCFRTREEIKFWRSMPAADKRSVRARAEERRLAAL